MEKVSFTKEQFKEDIEYIQNKIKEVHPNPYMFISKEELEKEFSNLKEHCDTNEKFVMGLRKILHKMKDSHTYIGGDLKLLGKEEYPFLLEYFKDGYYLIKVDEKKKEYIGKKVLKIGGLDIQEVEDRLRKYVSYENEIKFRSMVKWFFVMPSFLKEIGIDIVDPLKLEFEDSSILEFDYMIVDWEKLYSRDNSDLPYTLDHDCLYKYTYFKEIDTFYLQYNECDFIKKKEFRKIVAEMRYIKPEYFVVDMRNNIGGSSFTFGPILAYLKKKTKSMPTVVFTDVITFSSGIVNTLEITDLPNTYSFGGKTSGAPDKFGQSESFEFPNTGLNFHVSGLRFEQPDYDFGEPFTPNIEVNPSIDDYLNKRDVVWEEYLNWLKGRDD